MFCFSNPQTFGNVNRQLSAMPLTCFVQHKFFAHWPEAIENFAFFQTTVSSNCSCGHVKRNFDIFARNFIQEAEFFFLCPNMLKEKPFLFRKLALLKWFFQTGRIQLRQTAEKIVLTARFFLLNFRIWGELLFFQWKTVSLKCPLGQVDKYFDNPLD